MNSLLSSFVVLLVAFGSTFNRCAFVGNEASSAEYLRCDSIVQSAAKQAMKHYDYYPLEVVKELTYNYYTLPDSFSFQGSDRYFQWERIYSSVRTVDSLSRLKVSWGVLQNKSHVNGAARYPKAYRLTPYETIADTFGVDRYQAIPLFASGEPEIPFRYALDGTIVRILSDTTSTSDTMKIVSTAFSGEWGVPSRYVKRFSNQLDIKHLAFVDRRFQTITLLEKDAGKWKVRAMNPSTTGMFFPPHFRRTPVGMFLLQEKRERMIYNVDGTRDIEGFAPYANRFCCGAYIHGVAMKDSLLVSKVSDCYEYSSSLGTTPRSHMCVRDPTSLAKYIYQNYPTEKTLVFVIE